MKKALLSVLLLSSMVFAVSTSTDVIAQGKHHPCMNSVCLDA